MTSSVLVIEDDAITRTTIASVLEDLGYQVFTAENGRAGLDLYAAEPADLVITDIYMPEKDGIETIMSLREKAVSPKIIAMSGGGEASGMDVLRMARLLGADATMLKPVSVPRMLREVADLLGETPPGPAMMVA